MSKSLLIQTFLVGILLGLIIGHATGQEGLEHLVRYGSLVFLVYLGFFWRKTEAAIHRMVMDRWSLRRLRGRWRFILVEYALPRSLILSLVFPGSVLGWLSHGGILLVLSVLAGTTLLFVYLGRDEWTRCESEYDVKMLRQVALQIRTQSN